MSPEPKFTSHLAGPSRLDAQLYWMTDNAFKGKLRQKCLKAHWFLSLADVIEKLEGWRRYCNKERPHGVIGSKSPIILVKSDNDTNPPT